jgi:hypothetical protein
MGKKITSFIVVVAALLLSLQVNAQTSVTRTVGQPVKAKLDGKMRGLKANPAKTVLSMENIQKSKLLKAKLAKLQDVKEEAFQKVMKNQADFSKFWDKNAEQTKLAASKQEYVKNGKLITKNFNGRDVKFSAIKAPARKVRRAEVKDDHGIITEPADGEHKFYVRSGGNFYVQSQSVYAGSQSDNVEIVECEDGTVYIKDIVSTFATNAWVKGTIDGTTLTVPTAQPVAYSSDYQATLSVNWANYDETNEEKPWIRLNTENITFTIDEEAGTISLDGSSQTHFIGIFWDDDN